MFLLVPAHLGSPGQRAVKRLLLFCMTISQCVWCMSLDIEEELVRQHFSVCGAITNVRVIRDQKTGAGKGFGYVTFVVTCDIYCIVL